MGEGAGDIVIKGGSVELGFDNSLYLKDSYDPWRYKNDERKIVRIIISGDLNFDSGSYPNGLRCEIRVVTR
jgi:hypothetical protein